MKPFKDRIRAMNEMYRLPVADRPGFHAIGVPNIGTRIEGFWETLQDEINELEQIADLVALGADQLDVLTAIADLLGDIIVYCRSEAMKYGIPLEEVLDVIMDSNESKLGADGKPIYDANGKFLKGPNYWKPEEKIKELIRQTQVDLGARSSGEICTNELIEHYRAAQATGGQA